MWCWMLGLWGRLLYFLMLRLAGCCCQPYCCFCSPWTLASIIYLYTGDQSYELLCRFRSPTTSPTTNPTIHSIAISAITASRLHPPLFAICLLLLIPFLTSDNFSPCGPSTPVLSNWLYSGGLPSKFSLGGAPKPKPLWPGRFHARGGTGGTLGEGKEAPSSSMGGSDEAELGSRRCMLLLLTGVERIVKMKAIFLRRRGYTAGYRQWVGSRIGSFQELRVDE
jgi:hypothetical protein